MEAGSTPRELQVAMSYLDDVREQAREIAANDNEFISEREAEKLIAGDLALAYQEIDKAAAQGHDVSSARQVAYFTEGNLCLDVVTGVQGLIKEEIFTRWTQKAIDAFKKSLDAEPSPECWYNLGMAYAGLKQYGDALKAYREAQAGDDDRISVKVTRDWPFGSGWYYKQYSSANART